MKAVKTLVQGKSVAAVLAIGLFALGLTLEGAPTRTDTSRKTHTENALRPGGTPQGAPAQIIGLDNEQSPVATSPAPVLDAETPAQVVAREETLVRYGSIGARALPMAEPQVVNPYDDFASRMRARGELVGPYRRSLTGGVAGTGCSFDVECDDCDPCTQDECDIAGGASPGSGTCVNTPVPDDLVGECSDGLFCNGIETCQSGVCETPGSGTGTGGPDCTGGQICDEFQDECVDPCTSDASCSDDLACTGVESCGMDGICNPGTNPCGPGATCTELICTGPSPQPIPCQSDTQCPSGETCTAPGPGCDKGRCCDGLNCLNPTQEQCDNIDGDWYATDAGAATANSFTACGFDGMQCPRYGSGIGPQGEFDFDEINLISDSVCRAEDGAEDFVDNLGRRGSFRLGDDYQMIGDPAFVSLQALRWVGGVEFRVPFQERVVFEFYDQFGNFVEDLFFVSGAANAIRPLIIDPPLTIPTRGFLVAGVANKFSADGAVRWIPIDAAESDPVDAGANDPLVMWLEDETQEGEITPVSASFDYNVDEVPSSGILAFELVGDLLQDAPVGSCCDLTTGECLDNVTEWVCRAGTCEDTTSQSCVDSGDCPNGESCLRRTFLGVGSFCATCNQDSGLNAFLPCRRCGGTTTPCDNDDQCDGIGNGQCEPDDTFCEAGDGAGVDAACVTTTTCETGACCNLSTGACTEGQMSCPAGSEFLGFGTDCEPNCCTQPVSTWTGGDDCEDVIVQQFAIPSGSETRCNGTGAICIDSGDCGGDPCEATRLVVTLSGDNSGATSLEGDRDSCLLNQFNPNVEGFDPGWWEGFHIDDCALVRIDNCCTDPVFVPQYRVITKGCPCDASGFIFSNNQARGGPFCSDDNLWSEYGPLEPGTYFFPSFSALVGTHGPYQLHMTVEACPEAACCYLACDRPSPESCEVCSNDPQETCSGDEECGGPSDTCLSCSAGVCVNGVCRELCAGADAECGLDDDCVPQCDIMNQQACDALDGVFLGPPVRSPAVSTCIAPNTVCPTRVCSNDPGQTCGSDGECGGPTDTCLPCCNRTLEQNCGTCQLGSCCPEPGTCRERNIAGAFTEEVCETNEWPYFGGTKCFGGRCANAPQISCLENADCPVAGDTCVITQQQAAQPNPCPVCEQDNLANCRFSPQDETGFFGGFIFNVDRADGVRIADDFKVPFDSSGMISSICWDPGFVGLDETGALAFECADQCNGDVGVTFPDDQWQVVVYEDAGGIPGPEVAPPQLLDIFAKTQIPGFRVCIYSGLLPEPIPVTPGGCYWLEITGVPRADGCEPYWVNTITGNRYSFQDGDGTYDLGDAVPFDFTYCLDSGIDNSGPDCGLVTGACCTCPGPNCALQEFATCDDLAGRFDFDDATCPADPACPADAGAKDTCATREVVTTTDESPSVRFTVDTFCASTDGPDSVLCEGAQAVAFQDDVWYEYTASCTDDLTINTCFDNNDFDVVLAVYHKPDDPTNCGCPGEEGVQQLGACSDFNDDECTDNVDSFLRIPVVEGNCYTVRLGGQPAGTAAVSEGTTDVEFACGFTPGPSVPPTPVACANDFADATNGAGGERLPRFGCVNALSPPTAAGGAGTALRVTLKTMYNTSPGNQDGAPACPTGRTLPSLSQFEGQTRWLGAPTTIADDAVPAPPDYIAAPLRCTPEEAAVRDWTSAGLGGDFPSADDNRIYFYGSEVVPCSVYEVSHCGDPLDETTCSEPVLAVTGKVGDCWPPFAPATGQPAFVDIGATVAKFKSLPFNPGTPPTGAPPEWHALVRGNVVGAFDASTTKKVDFIDIGRTVDGFKTIAYREQGPCAASGIDDCGNPCSTAP